MATKKTKTKKVVSTKKPKPRNVETVRQAVAFDIYYALGPDRNVNKVFSKLKKIKKFDKIGINSLYRWQDKFFWKERVLAKDGPMIQSLRIMSDRDITETKLEFSTAIRNTIKQAFKTDKKGSVTIFNVPIKNIYDLTTATKLWLLLSGEATDIHSVRIEEVETFINLTIQTIQLHIKDPMVIASIAKDLRTAKDTIKITESNTLVRVPA